MNKALTALLVITLATSACTVKVQEGRKQASQTKITDVVDGDTVDINLENKTETVRLLGVDTPEVHVETQPEDYPQIPNTTEGRNCLEKYGEEASEFAREKLAGEKAEFVTDTESDVRGSYGRLLGYIYNDGENFNLLLIEKGYASVYESDFTKKEKFLEAEQEAQGELKGLWQCRSYEVGKITVK
jgi:micrococcal nuclease